MTNFIQTLLHNNQFFSGGAILLVLGGIAAYARQLPGKVWLWLTHRLFFEFEVPMNDPAFNVINEWLSKQSYTINRARWLTLRTERHEDHSQPPKIILSPAPGVHWLWWNHHFVIIHRIREDKEAAPIINSSGSINSSRFGAKRETFNISILTRKRNRILKMIEEAFEATKPTVDDPKTIIFLADYGTWDEQLKIRKRPIETVVLPIWQRNEIIKLVDKFRTTEQKYIARGIPYRLGMLWKGSPGNGKSSFALALAGYFNLDIAILILSSPNMTDEYLHALICNIPKNCILLIEDIDAQFNEERESTKDKDNKLTFSGLLNAIDGVAAGEGRILIMTTNHPERLNPALIRKGRVDYETIFDNATEEQVRGIYERFGVPCTDEDVAKSVGTCMAALQNKLIQMEE